MLLMANSDGDNDVGRTFCLLDSYLLTIKCTALRENFPVNDLKNIKPTQSQTRSPDQKTKLLIAMTTVPMFNTSHLVLLSAQKEGGLTVSLLPQI